MKSRLDRLEARLQAAIEKRLPWGRGENALATARERLIAAAESNQRREEGRLVFPDDYAIFLSPDQLSEWLAMPEILDNLTEFIQLEAQKQQAIFTQAPIVRLAGDPALNGGGMRVQAEYRPQNLEHTSTLPMDTELKEAISVLADPSPVAAFLIINGSEVYPLKQGVVNIGRRPDNTLVIDDGRVSRSHAQIRNIQGSFILFDLNSTGGTYVNNERVAQCSLQPGDVISLAGVQLIYGEDTPPGGPPSGSTSQLKPGAA